MSILNNNINKQKHLVVLTNNFKDFEPGDILSICAADEKKGIIYLTTEKENAKDYLSIHWVVKSPESFAVVSGDSKEDLHSRQSVVDYIVPEKRLYDKWLPSAFIFISFTCFYFLFKYNPYNWSYLVFYYISAIMFLSYTLITTFFNTQRILYKRLTRGFGINREHKKAGSWANVNYTLDEVIAKLAHVEKETIDSFKKVVRSIKKKYPNLTTRSQAFKLLNDPTVPQEEKELIEQLYNDGYYQD